MSPQRSNRETLIEGTLRCLEKLPPEQITARAITKESGTNLASICYHFGSKDTLVTEAIVAGLDRWLDDIEQGMSDVPPGSPATRFRRVGEAVEASRQAHAGLATNFVRALARAQHDPVVRDRLAEANRRTRPHLAELIGLGGDQVGEDAAGLVLALFNGLLLQGLLDPDLTVEGERMHAAQARLSEILPAPKDTPHTG
jgi:AcrR family transcriptional regulator